MFIEEKMSPSYCFMKDTQTKILSFKNKKNCIALGGKWVAGFDISGHAFLLVWCVFFITEEAKVIIGWDTIRDSIRLEEHKRKLLAAPSTSNSNTDTSTQSSMIEKNLNHLQPEEFEKLTVLYKAYDVYVKILLVSLTFLCILWDVMIVATAVYFHSMLEKVVGGSVGILMWFCCYKILYERNLIPVLPSPGLGIFKYSDFTSSISSAAQS